MVWVYTSGSDLEARLIFGLDAILRCHACCWLFPITIFSITVVLQSNQSHGFLFFCLIQFMHLWLIMKASEIFAEKKGGKAMGSPTAWTDIIMLIWFIFLGRKIKKDFVGN